jgi:hypothetical protein
MIKLSRKVLLLLVTLFVFFAFTTLKLAVNGSYRQHDNQITVSTALQGISEDDIKNAANSWNIE